VPAATIATNMCKHWFNADEAHGAMNVAKGREVLPTNVKPIHYRLIMEPNLESFEYKGKVEIEYVLRLASLFE
jgi:aminopeptidase 2